MARLIVILCPLWIASWVSACTLTLPVDPSTPMPWFNTSTNRAIHNPTGEHVVLLYQGTTNPAWTPQALLPYVAHLDSRETPDDWFFDTILFISLLAPSGHAYFAVSTRRPSDSDDWLAYQDMFLFGGRHEVEALDRTVASVAADLQDLSYREKVILTIPYPDPSQSAFGRLEDVGESLTFTREEDRLLAVQSYVSMVLTRWDSAHPAHLDLLGFYWISERIDPKDITLVRHVGEYLQDRGLLLVWIPYFGAPGATDWQQLGVTRVFYQPNYFYHDLTEQRLVDAMEFALHHNMGIEIECNDNLITSQPLRNKYRAYLDYATLYGFAGPASTAHYQGIRTLLEAHNSKDKDLRAIYDDTYLFIKGKYAPLREH